MYGRIFGNPLGSGAAGGAAVLGTKLAEHNIPGGMGLVQVLFVVVGAATVAAAGMALFRLLPKPQF